MESVINAEVKNNCHDCNKKIEFEGEDLPAGRQEIKNGVLLTYDNDGEKLKVFKCSECYKSNPSLDKFQKCEVYSRVVGYIRPVDQWHIGKRQEYKDRKEFKEV